MVREQEREARHLRDTGQIGAALDRYRSVIKFCTDASRGMGRSMAELMEEKKLKLQKELEEIAVTGGYSGPQPGHLAGPGALRGMSPAPSAQGSGSFAPPRVYNLGPENRDLAADNVAVPPSRLGGFRNPVTALKLDDATWDEYIKFTCNLKKEADLLQPTDAAAAAAKLREAADIWNYAVTSPRFRFFGTMRTTAREAADNYMAKANALQNPNGTVSAVNGPASSQVEAQEIERRVRDCIVRDTPTNKIGWRDIIGAKEAKDALLSALIDRYIYKGGAEGEMRGVLLYGPAGTGKTMLVRGVVNLVSELLTKRKEQLAGKKAREPSQELSAAASENNSDVSNSPSGMSENEIQEKVPDAVTLFVITAGDVDNKYVGEGTKFMQALFKVAREEDPAIIFIDEADALFSARGEGQTESTMKIMNQFMQETEGFKSKGNITVIAASNQPQKLDDAVLRRLQRSVYVPVPSPEDRLKILAQQLKHMGCPNDVPADKLKALALSKMMDNFTGADIKLLLNAARSQGPQADLHDAVAFREVNGELEPCSPQAEGAMPGNYLDFFGHDFKQLPVTFAHLEAAARKHRPTASKQIPILEKWKAELEASKS